MPTFVSVNTRTGRVNRWMPRRTGGRIVLTNFANATPGQNLDPAEIELFRTSPDQFVRQPEAEASA